LLPAISNYSAVHHLINHESFNLEDGLQKELEQIEKKNGFNHTRVQAEDIQLRYKKIRSIMQRAVEEDSPEKKARFNAEVLYMQKKWGDELYYDPHYSRNLTLNSEDFTYGFPPRLIKYESTLDFKNKIDISSLIV
jgi:uncharacterized membrane-anchored protein YjiN (DUF445 family)